MIASTHLAGGAAAAVLVQRFLPVDSSMSTRLGAAVVAGIASHVILDAPIHKEYTITRWELWRMLFIESGVVFLVLMHPFADWPRNAILFAGMVGGALPDLITMSARRLQWPWLGSIGKTLHAFHGWFPMGFEMGFCLQLLIALTAIILVKFTVP